MKIVDLDVKKKDDAEKKKALLEKEVDEVNQAMDDTMKELQAQGAHDEESHDEHDEDEDPTAVPTSKLEAWEARKAKYRKYADSGKVHKLEKARDKQLAKAKKAEETKKEKPYYEAYVKYKYAKVDFTNSLIKIATLVSNMKKAGLA